jgi:hypothetical protein
MAPSKILRTVFRALLMRSHAAKYAACVVLACAAAFTVALPVFGQTTPVTLVGAGDIADCSYSNDEGTAQLLGSTLRGLTPDHSLPPLNQARAIAWETTPTPGPTAPNTPIATITTTLIVTLAPSIPLARIGGATTTT